jgi:hypothetical protein
VNRRDYLQPAIAAGLALLFLVGCRASATDTTASIFPTATSVAATATQSPIPPTATVKPLLHQTNIEVVTDNAATGDGGNSWGGHQTRIVHTQDGVFTAYTVEGNGYFHREWRLAWRQDNGSWPVVASGDAGREPVNLLTSPDGTLNIIGWPNGLATIWSGKPENGTLVMTASKIPNELNGNWPYNSAGIDANGNLCVLSSEGGEQPGGRFYLACYLPSERRWVTRTSSLDYRFCYTYVFPGTGGQLSLVSTRDVRWEALGYTKPAGEFDYVFNAFGFWRTDDFAGTPLERVYFLEEKPSLQYPAAILNAQQDAYLDFKGQMHILYHVQGESTRGAWISRQAILSMDGILLNDIPLPTDAGDFSRIFQDQQGRFYLLGSSGKLYPMGSDGILPIGKPIILNLDGYPVEYSGFGISVPRTGTPPSHVMDVVFPSDNGTKWLYFQIEFSKR